MITALALALTATVGWVGDSITWAEQDAIVTELHACGYDDVHVDARPGRALTSTDTVFGYIPSGLDAIAQLEDTVDPDVWIIEQGLNDIHMGLVVDEDDMRAAIESVRAIIDRTDKLIWITTYSEQAEYVERHELFGEVLDAEVVAVADWAAIAPGKTYDGIHVDSDGAATMARLACEAIPHVRQPGGPNGRTESTYH